VRNFQKSAPLQRMEKQNLIRKYWEYVRLTPLEVALFEIVASPYPPSVSICHNKNEWEYVRIY
jgi:hypothetical protein